MSGISCFSTLMTWNIYFKMYVPADNMPTFLKHINIFIKIKFYFYIFINIWLVIIVAISIPNQVNIPFWPKWPSWVDMLLNLISSSSSSFKGADSFLLVLTPFQKGSKNSFDKVASHESVSIPKVGLWLHKMIWICAFHCFKATESNRNNCLPSQWAQTYFIQGR